MVRLHAELTPLSSVMNDCSRLIVHHEMRVAMKEADVERILHRAVAKFTGAPPRVISDDAPQSIVWDFKTFIRRKESCPDCNVL